MSKGSFYFSHDYNTRNDFKIKKLIQKHGFLGYGLWWALVEDLYLNNNCLYKDYEVLAYDLRCDSEIIESIINDFGLFKVEQDCFSSPSIEKRFAKISEKSEKARESVNRRWHKDEIDEIIVIDPDTNVLQTYNERNTDVIQLNNERNTIYIYNIDIDIKEKKEKLIKENPDLKIPEFPEFLDFAKKEKPTIDEYAVKAKYIDWIENGWKDGYNSPIQRWKTKLRNTLPHLHEDKSKTIKNGQQLVTETSTHIRSTSSGFKY